MTRRETQEKNFLTEVARLKEVGGEEACREMLVMLRRLCVALDAVRDGRATQQDRAIVTAGRENRHTLVRRLILADVAQEATTS